MLGPHVSIAELCERHPLAIPLIRARGIDPRDRAPFAAACARVGADPRELEDQLARDEARVDADWQARPLALLVDHIVEHYHRPQEAELRAVEHAIDELAPAVRARPCWSSLRAKVSELRDFVVDHLTKEESVLFPWVCTRADTAAAPIRATQLEHADTLALVYEVDHLAAACDPNAGARVLAALARAELALLEHLYLEDAMLFRRALVRDA